MFGKDAKTPMLDEKENVKVADRLDENESIVMSVRQSRVKPGGAAAISPNSIFLTEKRIIIRNPTRLGLGENVEEYFYEQLTNVRLEKGLFSASLVFAIPGMTELSKANRGLFLWGRDSEGTIDAIPKDAAETMYTYIREKVDEAKAKKAQATTQTTTQADPLAELKLRFVKGEITKEEFEEMKKVLEE